MSTKTARPRFKIMLADEGARMPTYGSKFASCFDLYCILEAPITLEPGERVVLNTGLIVDFPEGWGMDIFSRSGHGFKHSVRLSNCTGIIDSDYRNRIGIALHNDSTEEFVIKHGDRVAQGKFVESFQDEFEQVFEVSETVRGTAGLGSTGY